MDEFVIFKECLSSCEAQMIAEFLESNSISSKIQIDEPVPGLVNSAIVLIQKTDESLAMGLYAQQESISSEDLAKLSAETKPVDD